MCVCVFVRVSVCVFVRVSVCAFVCVSVSVSVHTTCAVARRMISVLPKSPHRASLPSNVWWRTLGHTLWCLLVSEMEWVGGRG